MKNHALIVLAGLCLGLSGTIAHAQSLSAETRSQAVALYNDDAPQILNNLVCVKKCEGSDAACDAAMPSKADGRCS